MSLALGPVVRLVPGREKKIRSFYPWVQREEVREVEGEKTPGLCHVQTHDSQKLGIGLYNPLSRFPVRMLSLSSETIDEGFFLRRFQACRELREGLHLNSNSWRIVSSEADWLPGLIIDSYDGHLVVQVRAKGMELLRDLWMPALLEVFSPKSAYERSDMAGRTEEGLEPVSGQLSGETPDEVEILEQGLTYIGLPKTGLKTGFYLDQRAARIQLGERVKPGDKVLDCFCSSGGFSLSAARAGATVVGVDILPNLLDAADRAAQRNGLDVDWVEGNAFEYLEDGAEGLGPFDWIILDPPAIAKTSEKKDSLKWAIWKLVYASLPLLSPHGRIVVCSCSYQIGVKEMGDTCRLAASDKGMTLFHEDTVLQDRDHPIPLHFPEALYLKSMWLRKG
jgi:23S rRNA (cytosine1962-C5)-methyltransferase